MLDLILLAVFPYVAVVLAVVFGIYRYQRNRFSYSSLSSQFLESSKLFWGSVPWHYAIILILLAHLFAALFPGVWAALVSTPARLYLVEVTGLALGIATVAGIVILLVRRITDSRIAQVTSVWDWILLVVLLLQVVSGVYLAFVYRWGSVWYLDMVVPWLWSLAALNPNIESVAIMPIIIKLHIFLAFVLVLLFPFTKLVHLVSVPLEYLIRPYQVVVWYRKNR
ncbi:MAG: respiratory nitrate reductase subunit gamma [Clostridia bacterium]|jgi:nitrate reductase gamma subunit|nr:respiratory nitrate reductase subunit gamma [Clostridia bacterium]